MRNSPGARGASATRRLNQSWTAVTVRIIANITTDIAGASPMRKYWKPYFSTSSPSTSVELAGPPGSVLSTYCRVKVWNALIVLERGDQHGGGAKHAAGRYARRSAAGVAPSICAASRNSGGMPARPASQISMKNGIAAQSCTAIIASGASTVLESQSISVTPRQAPASQVMIPFGCSSIRQTTATTTTGGRTGRKNSVFRTSRPRKTWSNSRAASKRDEPDRHRGTSDEHQRVAERRQEQVVGEEVTEVVEPNPVRRVQQVVVGQAEGEAEQDREDAEHREITDHRQDEYQTPPAPTKRPRIFAPARFAPASAFQRCLIGRYFSIASARAFSRFSTAFMSSFSCGRTLAIGWPPCIMASRPRTTMSTS